jgi:hypothetical protein
MDQQHIAPVGFPTLPISIRGGLRIQWGLGSNSH